jgi:hypothetical protein
VNHPIQPLAPDEHGTTRFKKNAIVDFLAMKFGLNELAAMDFPQEDWEQLAQLIGYSLSGFGELSYVRDETFATASAMAEQGITEDQARIAHLEETLMNVRDAVKGAATCLFRIHPDDLHE